MATIKSFTDEQQSKKLAEILPLESADMFFICVGNREIIRINDNIKDYNHWDTYPAWSLAALLGAVSEEVSLNSFKDGNWNAMVQQNGKMIYSDADNPVDTCVAMIEKLNELKML